MDISDNIAKINDKIKSAAAQAGRSSEEIKLIAVSKKKSTDSSNNFYGYQTSSQRKWLGYDSTL